MREEVRTEMNEKEEPKGQCYANCMDLILNQNFREDEAVLVHGEIFLGGTRNVWIKHAWVELNTGYIYDGQFEFMEKEKHDSIFPKRNCERYTIKEALIIGLRTNNKGPWTKHEIEQCRKWIKENPPKKS